MNAHVSQPISGAPTVQQSGHVVVHTYGACINNPGPGGWAAVLRMHHNGAVVKRTAVTGKATDTTNNRMELMAAIMALEAITPGVCPITIVSDSQYVVKGMTEWLENWKRNRWRNSKKKPVENRDLWERLDELYQLHGDIRWEWVRGHNGDPLNEEVDALATAEAVSAATDLKGE
jgi:ribonuclease HI